MKEQIKGACIGAVSGLIIALLSPCLMHWLDKAPIVQVVDIAPQVVHIGDESRPDYPDQPDGRKLEAVFSILLPKKPSFGVLYIEAYDVDLIGADVLFNGKEIGALRGFVWAGVRPEQGFCSMPPGMKRALRRREKPLSEVA